MESLAGAESETTKHSRVRGPSCLRVYRIPHTLRPLPPMPPLIPAHPRPSGSELFAACVHFTGGAPSSMATDWPAALLQPERRSILRLRILRIFGVLVAGSARSPPPTQPSVQCCGNFLSLCRFVSFSFGWRNSPNPRRVSLLGRNVSSRNVFSVPPRVDILLCILRRSASRRSSSITFWLSFT